jgi:hypothetical protein
MNARATRCLSTSHTYLEFIWIHLACHMNNCVTHDVAVFGFDRLLLMSVSYSYLHVPQEEKDYRQVRLHTGQKEIRNETPYRAASSTVLRSYT